ncbi:MAG: 1-deoxy-D-xylulose-5-phosphate synthase [Rikenella sp.]|nr:1-deoxy-D-xylulose-5-phosphate synthase [Rikenella sp.]
MTAKATKYLDRIDSPADLRRLSADELAIYCAELREFIVREVSTNPGHLGSSLGAVELAVAIHYVYDTPKDRLVWDVGHQAYAHKIITGRRALFHTNRKLGGISGFPKMSESEYDAFGAGHSSTSISAALGLARALQSGAGERPRCVAVIGDGAMTGGLAFEGLNNAGADPGNDILVVLNDNRISIDPNVGALKEALLEISTSRHYNRFKNGTWRALKRLPRLRRVIQKVMGGAKSFFLHQSNLFESLNFRYFGPVDGHDVAGLVRALRDLRDLPGPKLLHVLTVKGKGYAPAELDQTEWHAPGRFDPETGVRLGAASSAGGTGKLKFQEIFGHTLVELAERDERIVGITPAMPTGCSMNLLMERMPERTYDVGIAEGHAVTFAAGLAAGGKVPFCNIYSSFMQRAVDNIIHDAALQRLPVVLCLDRAGLVGEDGATHHGAFDLALLRGVPNLTIVAPMDAAELRNAMYTAAQAKEGMWVIRYPRGGAFRADVLKEPLACVETGRGRILTERSVAEGASAVAEVAILSVGAIGAEAERAVETLAEEGTEVGHYDLRFVKPLDTDLLDRIAERGYRYLITVEDGVIAGGAGSAVLEYCSDRGYLSDGLRVVRLGLPDRFVEHGAVEQLRSLCGIDAVAIAERVRNLLR